MRARFRNGVRAQSGLRERQARNRASVTVRDDELNRRKVRLDPHVRVHGFWRDFYRSHHRLTFRGMHRYVHDTLRALVPKSNGVQPILRKGLTGEHGKFKRDLARMVSISIGDGNFVPGGIDLIHAVTHEKQRAEIVKINGGNAVSLLFGDHAIGHLHTAPFVSDGKIPFHRVTLFGGKLGHVLFHKWNIRLS